MKNIKKILALVLCGCIAAFAVSCGKTESNASNSKEAKTLTIAYQGGSGYAPVHVMEAKKLIEENYDGNVTVTFQKLDSGAAINEGIIGGTIDIGCMGLAPAISGVVAGVPYKIISNLCSQSHGLMTNNSSVKSLSDLKGSNKKIALVKEGSFQHILLAMACDNELGDAHALDNNIQAMAHAEGMSALESGTVDCHLTSSPFIEQERESGKYTELDVLSKVWPAGNSFLVATAATSLEKNEPALFAAVEKAFSSAIEFINTNKDETAQIETTYLGLDKETCLSYLGEKTSQFFGELKGAKTMADFMYKAKFIEKEVTTVAELKYESVKGE